MTDTKIERERGNQTEREKKIYGVCVRESEREREREGGGGGRRK